MGINANQQRCFPMVTLKLVTSTYPRWSFTHGRDYKAVHGFGEAQTLSLISKSQGTAQWKIFWEDRLCIFFGLSLHSYFLKCKCVPLKDFLLFAWDQVVISSRICLNGSLLHLLCGNYSCMWRGKEIISSFLPSLNLHSLLFSESICSISFILSSSQWEKKL